MRLAVIGLVMLFAGCVEADRSPKGVGFGSHATPQGNDRVMAGNQAVQRPLAATHSPRQGTGVAARGLPVYRYNGRRANSLRLSNAAEAALTVNNAFGAPGTARKGTHKPVILAGHEMLAQQVYVGSHHFVVLRLATAKHRMFGIGGGKKKRRIIMSDVAKLTGCAVNEGIYFGQGGYAVPINCL